MEKNFKITISPKTSETIPSAIPVLGIVKELKPGVYAVLKKAQPNKNYTIICPKCGKVLFVKGLQKQRWKETCGTCKTKVWLVGNPSENPKQKELKKVEPKESSVTKEQPKEEEKVVSSSKESAVVSKTHKIHIKGQPSTGKFVWGGFFKKKSYVLKEGANYIGRTDMECPSDMMIDDDYASRRSVKVEVEKGVKGYLFKLTVVNATNSVLYNGKSLEAEHSIYLNYGDIITLGNTKITFKPVKS